MERHPASQMPTLFRLHGQELHTADPHSFARHGGKGASLVRTRHEDMAFFCGPRELSWKRSGWGQHLRTSGPVHSFLPRQTPIPYFSHHTDFAARMAIFITQRKMRKRVDVNTVCLTGTSYGQNVIGMLR